MNKARRGAEVDGGCADVWSSIIKKSNTAAQRGPPGGAFFSPSIFPLCSPMLRKKDSEGLTALGRVTDLSRPGKSVSLYLVHCGEKRGLRKSDKEAFGFDFVLC